MIHKRWLAALVIPALILAGCGGDDSGSKSGSSAAPTAAATEAAASGQFNPGAGTTLSLNPSGLPGCGDPSDTACPAPLQLDLDGEVSADGLTIQYPARYFTVLKGDENTNGVPIEIRPGDNFNFENEAVFQVFFAPNVEQALSELTDPLTARWNTPHFSGGTIGVVKDASQDPQVNTVVGAFPVGDGRTVVLRLVTTGKYGWDLFSRTYEGMLNSLTVSDAGGPLSATESATEPAGAAATATESAPGG